MARAEEGVTRPGWLRRFVAEHARVFFFSLGKLLHNPAGTLLTAAVIGVTLALPAALHLAVSNVERLSYSWQGALQFSLFLKDEVDAQRGAALTRELAARDGVREARYVSREQSAAEFREFSGFGEVLDLLEHNPLPAVIVVNPDAQRSAAQIEQLAQALGQLPEVELAQLDQRWLQRLYAILAVVQRAVLLIATLLALAVLVTIGNTLRLDIEARREEIVVMKLVGATDAFVRRPFLYGGCWLGLLGSWVALALLSVVMALVSAPARELAQLYESRFAIAGPSLGVVLLIVAGGVVLGWLGAWWTVSRHLSKIEPA